ncbi:hypothetical protein PR202_ga13167 [Eleusine coracana subsp. coracana]|uniref:Uncharacterized protein n=1 Tax=Eleusine coracana subsp. coracana TaxID=191504 RepID=A0AAV5CDZ0_ELECO|nr:hypothetical protein PR202_ga13167 [Eleusine coracana subsp. coracana]
MGRRGHTRDDMADEHTLKTTQPRGSSNESVKEERKLTHPAEDEKEVRSSLLDVREEQATLYDPKNRSFCCCRGDCGPPYDVFDYEEECEEEGEFGSWPSAAASSSSPIAPSPIHGNGNLVVAAVTAYPSRGPKPPSLSFPFGRTTTM